MNLDERLKRLEGRRTRGEPLDGVTLFIGLDSAIAACAYCPPLRPDAGLAGLYAALIWRHRETCPDAGACENADRCRANGEQSNSRNS